MNLIGRDASHIFSLVVLASDGYFDLPEEDKKPNVIPKSKSRTIKKERKTPREKKVE